ncbi:amidohydrolase [Marinicella gelatinilytica]|uniref:amidohydrolase n=1 Tax=Marinicella gelatinilytica TaxID=2996017 RepID=UPI002260EF0D|nr:amidohydrolase [Marinicella gelatinilytica]MCX7545456.1 amidohydrolase [Marinicella gelatinilytica]
MSKQINKISPITLGLCAALALTGITANAKTVLIKNINGYSHNGEQLIKHQQLAFDSNSGRLLDANKIDKFNETIDGQGKIVLAGLHDAHGHVLGYGLSQTNVQLQDIKSFHEVTATIEKALATHNSDDWLLGRGWNQALWPEKDFPNKSDLDNLGLKQPPIWLTRVDGHAGWANSAALQAAGITAEIAADNELIIKDDKGEPTGILIDNAMDLINRHVPDYSTDAKKSALQQAFKDLNAVGLTYVHDAGISADNHVLYREMAESDNMPIRVYAMLASQDPQFEQLLNQGQVNIANRYQMRAVKMMVDGALGSYGALLHEPYSDNLDTHGAYVQDLITLGTKLQSTVAAGFQAAIHAIGDRGNTEVLNLLAQNNAFSTQLRHRIEHAQIMRPEDIKRLADHDIIASMQPTHATSDKNMAEKRIGKDRMAGAYAWQTALDNKVHLAFGSDFPVELINPFYGLHAAVTRQDRDNQPVGGWYPEESLSIEDAFKAFTIGAAYAAHDEQNNGSLEPGKYADFIIIDQDIFNIDPKDIWRTQVLETWVNGKKVFSKQ